MGVWKADEIVLLSSEGIPVTPQPSATNSSTKIAENLSNENDNTQYLDDLDVADDNSHELVNVVDRYNAICAWINLSHCNEDKQQVSRQLLQEFTRLFHLGGDKLSYSDIVQHEVDLLPNAKPIFVKQYRIPEGSCEEMNRQIDEHLANGIIEPSTSEWNFPVLMVPKIPNAKGRGNIVW